MLIADSDCVLSDLRHSHWKAWVNYGIMGTALDGAQWPLIIPRAEWRVDTSPRSPGMLSQSAGANLNPIDFTDGQLAWTQVTTGQWPARPPGAAMGGGGS